MAGRSQALQVHPERCTGCRQCELACSWVQTGAFQPSRSLIRVHVFDEQASFAPYTCFQCPEAWCMQACPVNALDLDPATGAVVVLDPVCVGCKLCVIACPFGTIFFDKAGDRAVKCDLCAGDPACARACPTAAIEAAEAGVGAGADAGAWVEAFGAKVDADFRAALGGAEAPRAAGPQGEPGRAAGAPGGAGAQGRPGAPGAPGGRSG